MPAMLWENGKKSFIQNSVFSDCSALRFCTVLRHLQKNSVWILIQKSDEMHAELYKMSELNWICLTKNFKKKQILLKAGF